MNMDFDTLGLRTVGRAKAPLSFHEVRELEPSDLELLGEHRESSAPSIKKLRERHHALARLLAQGMKPGDAALVAGYSGSRVSILQADPSFQELVRFYTEQVHERYLDGHEVMKELHLDAAEELRERLEDDPERFSENMLLELMKVTADRTGLGPSTKTEVNVKVGLADRLNEARKRVAQDRAMRDVTPGDTE